MPSSVGPQLSRTPFPSASPAGWIPLYTMVTFRPDISYGTAKRKAESQHRWVARMGWYGTALGIIVFAGLSSARVIHRALRLN